MKQLKIFVVLKGIHLTRSTVRICLTKTKGVYTFRPTLPRIDAIVKVTDTFLTLMTQQISLKPRMTKYA
jgi:hypothetical protein